MASITFGELRGSSARLQLVNRMKEESRFHFISRRTVKSASQSMSMCEREGNGHATSSVAYSEALQA